MDQRDQMRAADSDREAVAERLRLALNEGRLDLHEYDERLQRAYAAKTYGDLDGLLADLPGIVPAAQIGRINNPAATPAHPAPAAEGHYPDATRRWLVDIWSDYFRALAITVAIWAVICVMSGNLRYFWPGWVAGPWGGVLMVATVTGLMRGEPQRWAAKERHGRGRRRSRSVPAGGPSS